MSLCLVFNSFSHHVQALKILDFSNVQFSVTLPPSNFTSISTFFSSYITSVIF